jgi:hypothetical protein
MLFRSFLRATAAVAFAALIAPAAPSAAPPPGLAYDEIVRVVVNATPPPPGNFQADLAALTSPQAVAASPTPAPKKRGIGIGAIAGALAGGGPGAIAGAVVGDAMSNAMDNAVQRSLGAQFAGLAAMARGFLQPHLMRYAYLNGWERVEDVTAQTVTIRKCNAGQVVHLDLAKKTYTVYDPNAEPTDAPAAPAPAPRRGRGPAPTDPQAPGTAVATLTSTTRALGPLRMENQTTAGYDSTTSFATTQSTGSCRDGGASIENVEYVAPITRPAVTSCPIRRRPVPETADAMVETPPSGGCRPTFSMRRSGPTPPANRLALYSLVTFGASGGAATPTPAPAASPGAGTVGFLTERGNLKTLTQADTGLFAIPKDFTKSP